MSMSIASALHAAKGIKESFSSQIDGLTSELESYQHQQFWSRAKKIAAVVMGLMVVAGGFYGVYAHLTETPRMKYAYYVVSNNDQRVAIAAMVNICGKKDPSNIDKHLCNLAVSGLKERL